MKHTYSDFKTVMQRAVDANGREYAYMANGQIIRTSPLRPWRGEAERKRVLKQRRLAK